jgi:hypothetical protein
VVFATPERNGSAISAPASFSARDTSPPYFSQIVRHIQLAWIGSLPPLELDDPTAPPEFDVDTQPMHDLCMATKTISIEIDAYELLVRERKDPKESFSRVIRRVLSERPALTAGDLLDAMKAFEGRGAGPRRRRSRDAAP